jgi:hypothetical protein
LKLPDVATRSSTKRSAGAALRGAPEKGDVSIGLIGAVLTLGTPQDVTLQELRVEMFMPADAASEAVLTALAA